MGLISGLADIGSGVRAKKAAKKATGEYVEGLEGLGPAPEYQGPDAFMRMNAAQIGDAETYDPTAAAFGSASASRGDVDTLYGDYNPNDFRDQAYSALQGQAADAINMAGGRRADQRRASERIVSQGAPAIEQAFSNQAQQLALEKGRVGAGVLGQRTGLNVTNAGAQDQAARFGAAAQNQVNASNAAFMQDANRFNTSGENIFNQTQADRAFSSDKYGYGNERNILDSVYGAKTGNIDYTRQMGQQIGSGVGDVANTAAMAATMGVGGAAAGGAKLARLPNQGAAAQAMMGY